MGLPMKLTILVAALSIGASPALAGTCRNYADGGHTVQSCPRLTVRKWRKTAPWWTQALSEGESCI
jgi:hypothetical protein